MWPAADPGFLQTAAVYDPLVTEDPVLSQQADRGTALLRGLQSGELDTSDVLDPASYGRFLAMVDLWGAEGSLSPFNISYAYDDKIDRLRPVALNANPFSGDYRLPPSAMGQDPLIQAAYAVAAAELSDPAYANQLRSELEPDYTELQRSLAAEVDSMPLWDELAARQEQLRLSLRPAQPVIAQLGPPELAQDAIIRVSVANTLNLPLEVLGFDIDGATFLESNADWIVDGDAYNESSDGRLLSIQSTVIQPGWRFVTFDLPVTKIIEQDSELDFLNEIKVQVATSVYGIDDAQLTAASPGLRRQE